MAVTRLKRKDRKNKAVSVIRKQRMKLATRVVNIKSPYKDESGIIIEDQQGK